MISVKEAVKQAETLLREVFPVSAEPLLDWIELTDGHKIWSVTFS